MQWFSRIQTRPSSNGTLRKERALLCFRGFGKTTLSQVHIVQCILGFPDIMNPIVGGVVAHAIRKMYAIVNLFNYSPVIEHLFPRVHECRC